MSARAGAAIIAVGNELLSGKVADTNSPHLIRELRELGFPLLETRTISDDVDRIAETFRAVAPLFEVVFTMQGEGEIAETLAETERRFAIAIGSYPRYDTAEYQVMITLESKEKAAVEQALEHLLERLEKPSIVRVE